MTNVLPASAIPVNRQTRTNTHIAWLRRELRELCSIRVIIGCKLLRCWCPCPRWSDRRLGCHQGKGGRPAPQRSRRARERNLGSNNYYSNSSTKWYKSTGAHTVPTNLPK